MDDDPDAMLRDSLFICACFWLAILSLAFLSACTPTVKHEVPQLDSATSAIKKIVGEGCKKPTLAMPPIPKDVVLDIKGDKITANKGGELMLRYYSRARQLLKPDAPGTTTP